MINAAQKLFLSTLSLRRATGGFQAAALLWEISIHALLAESDWWLRCWKLAARDISIHALLAESDAPRVATLLRRYHFYPRSPCGERQCRHKKHLISQAISIHALLAESDDCKICIYDEFIPISIHALLAESDSRSIVYNSASGYFYPRSPCGERLTSLSLNNSQTDFYPRSPCGERL